jgi:hypothetical protein
VPGICRGISQGLERGHPVVISVQIQLFSLSCSVINSTGRYSVVYLCFSSSTFKASLSPAQMNDPEATRAAQTQPMNILASTDFGGLVSAACNGVWLCPRYRDVLHICRESLVGMCT